MPDKSQSSTTPDNTFERVLAEILLAEEAGKPLDLSRAVRVYPELETPLREYFRNRDGFDRLASKLAPTASQRAEQAVPPDLVPGSRFAGYEIVSELGRGGMGVVYLAKQHTPKRLVALKLIRMDRLAHLSAQQRKTWLSRFRKEGETAARVEDERVATVFEVGTWEGRHFYSMRYVAGRNLADVVAGKALKNKSAAILMMQVARTVQSIHDQRVKHRDLKPHNIVVDKQGRPFVTDFGLAKLSESEESLTGTGEMLGSIQYMSPEQVEDAARVTEATDVYGLGATLYALLTGQPPFEGSTLAEIMHKVKSVEPVPPRRLNPAVHPDLDTLAIRCLQKEPDRRLSSAGKLADELQLYLDGKPIASRAIGRVERMWRWCRRNRAIASLSAAAVLLIALAGAAYWKYQSTADAALIDKGKADEQNAALERARKQAAYLKDMPLALEHYNSGELGKARELLAEWVPAEGEIDYRRWEWRFLNALCRETTFFKRGHDVQVQAVAWSPDGNQLASADRKGIVKVWNLADDKELFQVQLKGGGVIALAWSPDGKHLAAACLEMVQLLESQSGRETRLLQGIADKNRLGQVAANGLEAAAQLLLSNTWSASLNWSRDGRKLALVDSSGKVQVWDVTRDKNEPLLGTHSGGAHSAAWSPDSSRLATIGGGCCNQGLGPYDAQVAGFSFEC